MFVSKSGSSGSTLRPALFLDRDGVINEEVDYLYRPEDCRLVPGIASLLRTAHAAGYFCCVVTNQAGIGRGLYTEADFYRLMGHIAGELAAEGAALDAVYFCPDHPVHGLGKYRRESEDRKPQPGMLLRAAREHGLDLSRSILVGDRCTDLLAGHAAGLRTLFLLESTEPGPCPVKFPYHHVNALAAVEGVLSATLRKTPGPD